MFPDGDTHRCIEYPARGGRKYRLRSIARSFHFEYIFINTGSLSTMRAYNFQSAFRISRSHGPTWGIQRSLHYSLDADMVVDELSSEGRNKIRKVHR